MSAQKVLVIDDSRQILSILETVLEEAGYIPLLASGGETGLRLFEAEQPDLVVLDISLPGMDGWEVCRRIRRQSQVPIIMLSAAHSSVDDRVKGLDLGANDYIVKPFNQNEFMARVRANLRIAPKLTQLNQYDDGYLSINLLERRVERGGQEIDLTEKEFALLSALLRSTADVVSNEMLFKKVWGYPDSFDPNYVRIYMSSLRKKIEPDPKNPTYLLTERGVGYRFAGKDGRPATEE